MSKTELQDKPIQKQPTVNTTHQEKYDNQVLPNTVRRPLANVTASSREQRELALQEMQGANVFAGLRTKKSKSGAKDFTAFLPLSIQQKLSTEQLQQLSDVLDKFQEANPSGATISKEAASNLLKQIHQVLQGTAASADLIVSTRERVTILAEIQKELAKQYQVFRSEPRRTDSTNPVLPTSKPQVKQEINIVLEQEKVLTEKQQSAAQREVAIAKTIAEKEAQSLFLRKQMNARWSQAEDAEKSKWIISKVFGSGTAEADSIINSTRVSSADLSKAVSLLDQEITDLKKELATYKELKETVAELRTAANRLGTKEDPKYRSLDDLIALNQKHKKGLENLIQGAHENIAYNQKEMHSAIGGFFASCVGANTDDYHRGAVDMHRKELANYQKQLAELEKKTAALVKARDQVLLIDQEALAYRQSGNRVMANSKINEGQALYERSLGAAGFRLNVYYEGQREDFHKASFEIQRIINNAEDGQTVCKYTQIVATEAAIFLATAGIGSLAVNGARVGFLAARAMPVLKFCTKTGQLAANIFSKTKYTKFAAGIAGYAAERTALGAAFHTVKQAPVAIIEVVSGDKEVGQVFNEFLYGDQESGNKGLFGTAQATFFGAGVARFSGGMVDRFTQAAGKLGSACTGRLSSSLQILASSNKARSALTGITNGVGLAATSTVELAISLHQEFNKQNPKLSFEQYLAVNQDAFKGRSKAELHEEYQKYLAERNKQYASFLEANGLTLEKVLKRGMIQTVAGGVSGVVGNVGAKFHQSANNLASRGLVNASEFVVDAGIGIGSASLIANAEGRSVSVEEIFTEIRYSLMGTAVARVNAKQESFLKAKEDSEVLRQQQQANPQLDANYRGYSQRVSDLIVSECRAKLNGLAEDAAHFLTSQARQSADPMLTSRYTRGLDSDGYRQLISSHLDQTKLTEIVTEHINNPLKFKQFLQSTTLSSKEQRRLLKLHEEAFHKPERRALLARHLEDTILNQAKNTLGREYSQLVSQRVKDHLAEQAKINIEIVSRTAELEQIENSLNIIRRDSYSTPQHASHAQKMSVRLQLEQNKLQSELSQLSQKQTPEGLALLKEAERVARRNRISLEEAQVKVYENIANNIRLKTRRVFDQEFYLKVKKAINEAYLPKKRTLAREDSGSGNGGFDPLEQARQLDLAEIQRLNLLEQQLAENVEQQLHAEAAELLNQQIRTEIRPNRLTGTLQEVKFYLNSDGEEIILTLRDLAEEVKTTTPRKRQAGEF